MLQILRKNASDFTPVAGSNISFDVDHLKCDDYGISPVSGIPQRIARNPNTGRIWMRRSGGAPSAVWYAPANLGSWTQVNLSDGDVTWCSGLAVDDDDAFYKVSLNNRDAKKYNNAGVHQWTSIFAANDGCMFYPPTNHIYFCDYDNHRVREVDKAGNVIHNHLLTGDFAQGTNPSAVFIDNTGIYILCARTYDSRIMKYDLTWNYQSNIQVGNTNTLPPQLCSNGANMLRLSNGDYIIGIFSYSPNQFVSLIQVDSTGIYKKELVNHGNLPAIGQILSSGTIETNSTCFGATEDELYLATAYNGVVALMDARDSSERYAEYQHDFGLSVNIQRLDINALYDNRDESWKSMRLWYQLDGGGYVEVDMKDPLLAINGQVLDLRVGMTSYGFLRHWPEFYSIDILYDDGQSPSFEYPITGKVINEVSIKGVVSAN